MPWKETNVLEERVKFISRYLEGEKISSLCIEFDISRKTGHKIIKRYETSGFDGLYNRSCASLRNRMTTPLRIQKMIVDLKRQYSSWGAPKIAELFKRKYPNEKCPVISTVHAILDRNGMVKNRSSRPRYKATGTNLKPTNAPNDLWCIDYKGQFLLGNKEYCYPLTITDHYSRYLLCCEALSCTKTEDAFEPFEIAFKENGMPAAIRSDNGAPFSARALFGLSKLSVWWLRLGIKIERIMPGHPQQNGRHERMHRTLKLEVERRNNFLQQQESFDDFVQTYNNVRPHEALNMKTPSEIYKKSERKYPDHLPDLNYPNADRIAMVGHNGVISIGKQRRVLGCAPFVRQ